MHILCIGDSITEGDYGVPGKVGVLNWHEKGYPYFLRELSGCEVHNRGKSGYTATMYIDFIRQGGLDDVPGADIAVIMLGTNGGMELEPWSAGSEDYVAIIRYVQATWPAAQIVLFTPPHSTENPVYSNCGIMPQITKAVPVVETVARRLGLPVIDVFGYAEIGEDTVHLYQPNDGLHFTEPGYRVLAEFICSELKRLLPTCFV